MAVVAALVVLVLTVGASYAASPVQGSHSIESRSLGSISVRDRNLCQDGNKPANAVDTTERLSRLRKEMEANGISAYIVQSTDDHQSEYTANHDRRLEFITGFSGSNGDAVITINKAALWTDGRYFIQADQEMDCNWKLMKSGVSGTPTIMEWLIGELSLSSNVSSDARIVPYTTWKSWESVLESSNINLVLMVDNLVDKIWTESEGRESYPKEELTILTEEFAGVSWENKLKDIRLTMEEKKVQVFVVSALDEIAWILNLRGADVPYTPVFRSYLIIGSTLSTLYLPKDKITADVKKHLNSDASDGALAVRVEPYENFWIDLPEATKEANKTLVASVSYMIYNELPIDKVENAVSPIMLMKATKNDVEAQGIRNAHIRDAVAVCQLHRMLEEGIKAGEDWDELKVVSTLDDLRAKQANNRGSSFTTISAFGPNAALPHYAPTTDTNLKINTTSVFMLDSGGQYLDGTTDITRTIHLGTPTDYQRTIYTQLLRGCIDLETVKFPEGESANRLEILVRAPLYSEGLNFGHGTTHGIGAFLGVHESYDGTYHKNFFGSQEPGYYEENSFGMRLENIVTVISANMSYGGKEFLTFDPVTLVPYEKNMINVSLLTQQQLDWINNYHEKVRQIVGEEMVHQNLMEDHAWLLGKTEPISFATSSSNGVKMSTTDWGLIIFCMLFSELLSFE